jgi:hypothetical protein
MIGGAAAGRADEGVFGEEKDARCGGWRSENELIE